MEPRISFVTLGVSDLQRATRFYEQALGLPRIPTPPEVVFFEMGRTWLALYPRDLLAADAGVEPGPPPGSPGSSGFPGFSLAHNVASGEEVQAALDRLSRYGGRILRRADAPPYGGLRGYVADPDDHAWEIAWNPAWPISPEGYVRFAPV